MPTRNATAQEGPLARALGANGETRLRNRERGSARLKTIIWLVIMVAAVYAGIKIVPVLVAEYQFQDAMQTAARFASVNRMTTPEEIRKNLMDEAQKQNIPVNPEDIHISGTAGVVNIAADYSVTVDLTVYQLTLNFHPSAGNKPLV